MPLSTKPADETKKQAECNTATKSLRERWDGDWALARLDSEEYNIPAEEGEWEKVVTNRAAAELYKITDYLAYARRKLWIPINEEDKKGRVELTQTEQLANGCIYLADTLETGSPYHQNSQDALAFYRVARGWSAIRFLLREEDDKLIPDTAFWDPRNTYWIEGLKRIAWACYVRYATKEAIIDEYPGWNGNVGIPGKEGDSTQGQSLTAIYDVWAVEKGKEAEDGVIIGGEYVKEPEGIGLDYLPIRIDAGRTTPLIHDGKNTDNIKFVGEGWLASTRNLLPAESRLFSYQMTRAGELAKAPVILQFDSSKHALPKEVGDLNVKGRVIVLDVAKGQSFSDRLVPPDGADIMTMISVMQGMLQIGGLSSLAHGQPPYPETAQGTDIISHIDLQKMNPFKLGIQSDYVWWAEEIVRQYKNGKFKEYEIEGRDKANNPFKAKINPKKIDTNWKFECELIPDLLRDKAANLNWAVTAIKSGLMSVETARDQAQIVADTDLEGQKVAREQARGVFNLGELEAILALVKDYTKSHDPETLFILNYAFKKLGEAMGQLGGEQAPQGENTQGAEAVPGEVREAAQRQIAAQGTTAQGAPGPREV